MLGSSDQDALVETVPVTCLPLVDEDKGVVEAEVVEEEEVMGIRRLVLNGFPLDSGGSWRRRGQQGLPQPVDLVKIQGQYYGPGSLSLLGSKVSHRSS